MLVPIHHKAKKKYQLQSVKHHQKRSRQLQNYKQTAWQKYCQEMQAGRVNLLDVGVVEVVAVQRYQVAVQCGGRGGPGGCQAVVLCVEAVVAPEECQAVAQCGGRGGPRGMPSRGPMRGGRGGPRGMPSRARVADACQRERFWVSSVKS